MFLYFYIFRKVCVFVYQCVETGYRPQVPWKHTGGNRNWNKLEKTKKPEREKNGELRCGYLAGSDMKEIQTVKAKESGFCFKKVWRVQQFCLMSQNCTRLDDQVHDSFGISFLPGTVLKVKPHQTPMCSSVLWPLAEANTYWQTQTPCLIWTWEVPLIHAPPPESPGITNG